MSSVIPDQEHNMIDPARILSTSDLRAQVQSAICDTCQDLCWSVEVWGHDIAGSGERACWAFRGHISSQSTALAWAGRILASSAAMVLNLEARLWTAEHQLTLDLDVP